MQADLIMEQANALAQFGVIAEFEEKVESATEFRRQLLLWDKRLLLQ